MCEWKIKPVILLLLWNFALVSSYLKYNCQSSYTQSSMLSAISKRDKKLDKVVMDINFNRNDMNRVSLLPLLEDPMYPMVKAAILAGNSRKSQDTKSFRVAHLTEVTTFMVILQGTSSPQNQAIARTVEDDISDQFNERPVKQGDASGGWILLDYGSLIVHVMTPQMRNFYKLEKRWKDAEVRFKFNNANNIES